MQNGTDMRGSVVGGKCPSDQTGLHGNWVTVPRPLMVLGESVSEDVAH